MDEDFLADPVGPVSTTTTVATVDDDNLSIDLSKDGVDSADQQEADARKRRKRLLRAAGVSKKKHHKHEHKHDKKKNDKDKKKHKHHDKKKKKLKEKRKLIESQFVAEVTVGAAEKTKCEENFAELLESQRAQLSTLRAITTTSFGVEELALHNEDITSLVKAIADTEEREREFLKQEEQDARDTGVVSSDEDEDAYDEKNESDLEWERTRQVDDNDKEIVRNHKRVHKQLSKWSRKEQEHTDASALPAATDRRAFLTHAVSANSEGALATALAEAEKLSRRKPSAIEQPSRTVMLDSLQPKFKRRVVRLIELELKRQRFETGGVDADDANISAETLEALEKRITPKHHKLAELVQGGRVYLDRLCDFLVQAEQCLAENREVLSDSGRALINRLLPYKRVVNDVLVFVYRDPQHDLRQDCKPEDVSAAGISWMVSTAIGKTVTPEQIRQKFFNMFDLVMYKPGDKVWSIPLETGKDTLYIHRDAEYGQLKRLSRIYLNHDLLTLMVECILSGEHVSRATRSSFDASLQLLLQDNHLVNAAYEMLWAAKDMRELVEHVEKMMLKEPKFEIKI